jgi:glycosyltransferase involved in cell wall biosynthesis
MKIFLIGPTSSTFVKHDILTLSKEHTVLIEDSAQLGKGVRGIFSFLALSFRSVWKVIQSDVVISWFADYYSLIPVLAARLFGKKAVVIAGGFDVIFIPAINCGAKANRVRWFFVQSTFRFAHLILPVSNFAARSLSTLVPQHAPAVMIYNGVDHSRFASIDFSLARDIVLTVSQATDSIEYVRKGGKDFIHLARQMPTTPFILAGLRGEALALAKGDATDVKNLTLMSGPLALYTDLIPLFQRAAAYCQFSMSETFGVAVVEAMAAGCVPIIFPNGSLPEVAGDFGRAVHDVTDAVSIVHESFSVSASLRQSIAHYAHRFSLLKRETRLNQVLSDLS